MTHWTESAGTWRRSDGVEVGYAGEFWCVQSPARAGMAVDLCNGWRFYTAQSAMAAADKEWPISGGKEE